MTESLRETPLVRDIAELYAAHADMVYTTALNLLRSADDAADVTQDVFLGLPEALHRFDAKGSFAGWLKTVTVRTALMRIRRQARRREVDMPELQSEGVSADRVIDRITLERALDRLPEPLRTAFVLKEIEGYSHDDIARFAGISVAAAQVRLFRAKRQLRSLLMRPE